MVKKAMQYVSLLILLVICAVEGFFLNDYLTLRREREEMKAIAQNSLDLADRRTGDINSCMASLVSCTRIVDYEHPRVFEHMLKTQPSAESQSQHVAR